MVNLYYAHFLYDFVFKDTMEYIRNNVGLNDYNAVHYVL